MYLASRIGFGLFHQIYQVWGSQFTQALQRLCPRIDCNVDFLLLVDSIRIEAC